MGTFESKLIVSLTDNVSGAASAVAKNLANVEAAAKKLGETKATGLSEISTALAKIGQYRDAAARLNELAAASEKARAKARELASTLMSSTDPTAKMKADYTAATRAVDMTGRQLEKQRAAVAKAATGLQSLGIATNELSAAEARLRVEASSTVQAMQRQAAAAASTARLEKSRLKEMSLAANEQAAANQRAAEAVKRAAAEEAAAAERAAAAVVAAEERMAAAKARRFRDSFAKESLRACEEERVAAEQTTRAIERQAAAQAKAAKIQTEAAVKQAEAARIARRENLTAPVHASTGILGMIIGGGIEHAGIKMVENAAHTEQLQFRVRELSRHDPTEAPFADKLSSDIAAKYPAISKEHALDTYLELRANAGSEDPSKGIDQAKARKNLEIAAKAQNSALALGFEMTPVDMQNLVKGIEGSGRAEDPEAVRKISDAYLRAKQVFGSAIASSMIRDYVANAKSANFSVGDDQFYLTNMVRMSEGNASRLGNETNQTLSTIVGGHMTRQAALWMAEYGLIKPEQIVNGKGGKFFIKGDVKDSDTLENNPQDWSTHTMRKAIEDRGDVSEDKVRARMDKMRAAELKKNPKAEIDERFLRFRAEEALINKSLQKTGWRTSVTDNLAHAIGNERLIERDTAQLQNASGIEAGDRIRENPVATFKELTSAISNFGSVLAGPGVKDAAGLMDSVAHGIGSITASLTEFQRANPMLAKIMSDTAISGTVLGGGAVMLGVLDSLKSGFGLSASAVALNESAAALTGAAEKIAVAGELHAVPPGGPGGPGVVPLVGSPGTGPKPMSTTGVLTTLFGYEIGTSIIDHFMPKSADPKNFENLGIMGQIQRIGEDFKRDPFWSRVFGPSAPTRGPAGGLDFNPLDRPKVAQGTITGDETPLSAAETARIRERERRIATTGARGDADHWSRYPTVAPSYAPIVVPTPAPALAPITGPASRPFEPQDYFQSVRNQRAWERDPEAARGRAMLSRDKAAEGMPTPAFQPPTMMDATPVGQQAGAQLGAGIAQGLEAQSGLVQGVAQQIMANLRSVMAQGVDVPVRVQQQGTPRPAAASTAPATSAPASSTASRQAPFRATMADTGDRYSTG